MYEQISPHEFVQEVSVSSKKRFHVGKQNESVEFLSWLLNELHRVRFYHESSVWKCAGKLTYSH